MDIKDVRIGDLIWVKGKTVRNIYYVESVGEDRLKVLSTTGIMRTMYFKDIEGVGRAYINEIRDSENIDKNFYGRLLFKEINEKLKGKLHELWYEVANVMDGYILKPKYVAGSLSAEEYQRAKELRARYSIGYVNVNTESYSIGVYRVCKKLMNVDYRMDPRIAIFIGIPNRLVQKSLLESIADKFSVVDFDEEMNRVEYYYEKEVEREVEEELVEESEESKPQGVAELKEFIDYYKEERKKIDEKLQELSDKVNEWEKRLEG